MTDCKDNMNNMWNDFGRLFDENFDAINKRLDSMFTGLMSAPGIQTYGYTMYQSPDGMPYIQEFENAHSMHGMLTSSTVVSAEPLTDVQQDGDVVRATFEIPGVDKKDIDLEGTTSSLTVKVNTPGKKFAKTVALPCDVDMNTASAVCNNGILEVTLKTIKSVEYKKKIDVN